MSSLLERTSLVRASGLTGALTVVHGENFTIQGDIDRNGTADITIDGQNLTRLMNVQSGATLALDTIIMANGRDTGAAGGAGGAGGTGGNGGRRWQRREWCCRHPE